MLLCLARIALVFLNPFLFSRCYQKSHRKISSIEAEGGKNVAVPFLGRGVAADV